MACKEHKGYRGQSKPTSDCVTCWALYHANAQAVHRLMLALKAALKPKATP